MRQDGPAPLTVSKAQELTPREAAFVAAYAASRNATKSAETAGYSAKSAHVLGSRLLKNPRVAAAIRAAMERITKKYEVSGERTIQEMAVIAYSDIRHYCFDSEGYLILAEGAPDAAVRAIKRVKRKPVSLTVTDDEGNAKKVLAYETELELWNKDVELRNLAEHLKLFDNSEAQESGSGHSTPDELRERVISVLRTAAQRRREAGLPASKLEEWLLDSA